VTRSRRNFTPALLFILLTALWPVSEGAGAQQEAKPSAQGEKFLDTNVPEFDVHDLSLLNALWKLAGGPAPFGFGFEKVLKNRLSDPNIPDPHFSLRMRGKSAREILDALCRADSRYTWSSDGTAVDIFPKNVVSDPSYLLNRKLETLELHNVTDVQGGLLAITRELPPPFEQVAIAQIGGADPYPAQPWTITFHNLTVRKAINRLAAHGGSCGTWIFGGAKDFRSFGFFNTYRCPNPRPTMMKPSS
jgi:hypothetical protein